MSKTLQNTVTKIARLDLNDDDTLVLTGDFNHEFLHELVTSKPLKEKDNVGLILLHPGQTIETVSEKQMRHLGWVRKDKNCG